VYSRQVETQLHEIERLSVSDYIAQSPHMAALHGKIRVGAIISSSLHLARSVRVAHSHVLCLACACGALTRVVPCVCVWRTHACCLACACGALTRVALRVRGLLCISVSSCLHRLHSLLSFFSHCHFTCSFEVHFFTTVQHT
jgi:hypothetical protein